MSDLEIRPEQPGDRGAIRDLLVAAFPTHAESALVEALRGHTEPWVSLVALRDGELVGHILFTPVAIGAEGGDELAFGLGPMAVTPAEQRRGAGSALVEAGLAACRALGASLVVVLGHADYYPRFGFTPAHAHGLYFGEPGANPSFFALALRPGALDRAEGEVRYHPAFDGL